jgi:hypothetical protein
VVADGNDLDLIFEIERIDIGPLQLHNIVDARLKKNELYAARLVNPAPARCLRLSYAGDFISISSHREKILHSGRQRSKCRIEGSNAGCQMIP